MIDKRKVIFLPADQRIFDLYKGYVVKGKARPELKEKDIFINRKKIPEIEFGDGLIRIVKMCVSVLFLPVAIPWITVWAIRNRERKPYLLEYFLHAVTNLLLGWKYKPQVSQEYREPFLRGSRPEEEDVEAFLQHCKSNGVTVFLYQYDSFQPKEEALDNLVSEGLVESLHVIQSIDELASVISGYNVSLHNSVFVATRPSEIYEANAIGFENGDGWNSWSRIKIWNNGQEFKSQDRELWVQNILNNSTPVLNHSFLTDLIERYLNARQNLFLNKTLILFVEDEYDDVLNTFISNNLGKWNDQLRQKGMTLLYFPGFLSWNSEIKASVYNFLRHKWPSLYSLSDGELDIALGTVLSQIPASVFYRFVLEGLDLPYFPRPALIRNIKQGYRDDANKFTFTEIKYRNLDELQDLFEWYLGQVYPPKELESQVLFSLGDKKNETSSKKESKAYNAEVSFEEVMMELSDGFKREVNALVEGDNSHALAMSVIYMLSKIKEEKPELLNQVNPLIHTHKLLSQEVILSPLIVDQHYKIYLPEFGNQEVKMHALPKTLYLLYLKYPKGIRFKELYDHKEELLDIYNKVTNKYENSEIEKAIDDLVDVTNPSLVQKCSRVREAFRKIMDEDTAKHYYIQGKRGQEKKITLPSNLIDIRF